MASRQKEKSIKREMQEKVATVNTFENRLKSIEDFLGQLFGASPETQNFQFLIGEMRQARAGQMQMQRHISVLETYIIETNQKEAFQKWHEAKGKEADAAQAKAREAALEAAKKKRTDELANQPQAAPEKPAQ